MKNDTFNLPAVYFWFGVLVSMHEAGRGNLRTYAMGTILNMKRYDGPSLDTIDFLLTERNFTIKPAQFRQSAWDLARYWVLHGPGMSVIEPDGMLLAKINVHADGMTFLPPSFQGELLSLAKEEKPKPKPKAKPNHTKTLGSRLDDMPPSYGENPF